MPAKKKLRSELEGPSDDVALWIKANDELIGDTTVTISSLFDGCTIKEFAEQKYDVSLKRVATTGKKVVADWSKLRSALEARTADSPLWFIQRRTEDLLLEPDGTIGERVESFVIVESPHITLAPRHYILSEPLPDADPEDHVPSRVMNLKDQDVKWNPIAKADGTLINAYVLQRKSVVPAFSFGAAAPTAAAAAPSSASPAAGFGFGFGAPAAGSTAAPAPVAAGFGFSFGAAAPAAAAPAPSAGFGFSFGAAAPSVTTTASAPTSSTPVAVPSVKRIPVDDILFTIWDLSRVKEMKQLAASGSRIVIENFKLPNVPKPVKLVMQDDVEDTPEAAAAEFVLKKLFARQNERLNSFDKWMDDCPEIEPNVLEFLQKTRDKMLKSESKLGTAEEGEMTYADIYKQVSGDIIAALSAAVLRRVPIHESQTEILDEILAMLKVKKLASKDHCRVLKFYPSNSEIPFRPFGKVSGISGEGEEAVCEPPAYRFINPFTGKSS